MKTAAVLAKRLWFNSTRPITTSCLVFITHWSSQYCPYKPECRAIRWLVGNGAGASSHRRADSPYPGSSQLLNSSSVILTDLILYRSNAGNHSHYEFMSIVLPRPLNSWNLKSFCNALWVVWWGGIPLSGLRTPQWLIICNLTSSKSLF